ncbi:MAG TPA: hypothetical protein VG708_09560 [Mycobacteriales bacterium]|nr:hypothetical protein [Mycobacteriales bacterium]
MSGTRSGDGGTRICPPQRSTDRGEPRSIAVADLESRRRKLLELYYADRIGADLFAEQEQALRTQISSLTQQAEEAIAERRQSDDLARRFEAVVATLADLDPETLWAGATRDERRTLVEGLVEEVALHPDHLEVTVAGAPRLNVLLEEVGVQSSGVGGGTWPSATRSVSLRLSDADDA